MKSRFKVVGTFDVGGGLQRATVEIDRATNIVCVRPCRRRRTYSMTLTAVAAWICQVNIRAELRELREVRRRRKKP